MRLMTNRWILLAAALAFLLNSPASAQSAGATPKAAPTTAELQKSPTTINTLGLTLYVPEGSVAETVSYGTESTTAVAFKDDLGLMTIKGQRTKNPDLTTELVAESIIKQLTIDERQRKIGELLSHDKLRIKFWKGHRFYVRQLDPKGGPDVIFGYTIFQNKPRSFIVFELRTNINDQEQAQTLYETSVGTIDLGNPDEEDARRSAAIKSTLSFMDGLSIEDFKSVLTGKDSEHWERLYTPAPSGDEMDATEHGYRRIRSWTGYKGEITPKDRSEWTADDRTPGYLFQLDAMALEEGLRIDTRAIYFMSDAQDSESWTVRMSIIRELDDMMLPEEDRITKINSAITGARDGTSMNIYLQQNNQAPTLTRPLIQGEGYISQVQTYLHSRLLASKKKEGEFASYAFNPAANTVLLRWDIVEQPEESPGLWKVTTKVADTAPATVAFFNERNDILRVRLANGRIWEPIELDKLLKLWKKKDLPLE